MSVRNILLVSFAVVAALGTAMLARGWMNAQQRPVAAAPKAAPVEAAQQVLVAKAALPAGRFIKPEDLRWQAWPEGQVPATYMLKGKRELDELTGAVVRSGFAADEPITDARIVKPGERGFMAAVLEPGFRAVSVSVTATSGIAGFVFPGDHVDLLVTHSVSTDELSSRKTALVTETVLADVRVVAIDQKTDDQTGTPTVARTITFEVTPKQAEMVNVARRLGEMTLSLRSLSREELQGDLVNAELDEGDAALPAEVVALVGEDKAKPADKARAAKVADAKPGEVTIAEGRFTIDNEVSRLIGGLGETQRIQVVRGEKVAVMGFRNGAAEDDRPTGDQPRNEPMQQSEAPQ
jgi:pilus assembly protein CpaB